jgi:hypothetical protein
MQQIYDDLLTAEEHQSILDEITHPEFLWRYTDATVPEYQGDDSPQFVRVVEHMIDKTSKSIYAEGVRWREMITAKLPYDIDFISRTKVNMLLPSNNSSATPFHAPHVDITTTDKEIDKYYSLLYYVNNSDGDTHFFPDEGIEKISPKPNRCVVFPAMRLHASSSPTTDRRIVINTVFKIK